MSIKSFKENSILRLSELFFCPLHISPPRVVPVDIFGVRNSHKFWFFQAILFLFVFHQRALAIPCQTPRTHLHSCSWNDPIHSSDLCKEKSALQGTFFLFIFFFSLVAFYMWSQETVFTLPFTFLLLLCFLVELLKMRGEGFLFLLIPVLNVVELWAQPLRYLSCSECCLCEFLEGLFCFVSSLLLVLSQRCSVSLNVRTIKHGGRILYLCRCTFSFFAEYENV